MALIADSAAQHLSAALLGLGQAVFPWGSVSAPVAPSLLLHGGRRGYTAAGLAPGSHSNCHAPPHQGKTSLATNKEKAVDLATGPSISLGSSGSSSYAPPSGQPQHTKKLNLCNAVNDALTVAMDTDPK